MAVRRSTVRLLDRFMQLRGIRVDALAIDALVQDHPLPHSMRALSDTLDALRVPNLVCKLDFEQLFEIGKPFIVVAGDAEYPFYLAEKIDADTEKITLRGISGRKAQLAHDQFRTIWSGTVLMAEKGEQTREAPRCQYWIRQGLWWLNHAALYWIVALAIGLLVVGLSPLFAVVLPLLVKLLGLAVSLVIVLKSSLHPHLADRFCRMGRKTDCNSVFHARGAKLLGWIPLGELASAFFGASVVWSVFLTNNPLPVMSLLDAVALLFVSYSVIWQIYHNKWCSLCLLLDVVLVAGFVIDLYFLWRFGAMAPNIYSDMVGYGLLFALLVLVQRRIMTLVESDLYADRQRSLRELLLASSDTFWNLLSQQAPVAIDSHNIPVISNRRDVPHTITVVMNPLCPKCAMVHETIRSLDDYRIDLVLAVDTGNEHAHCVALSMISVAMQRGWDAADQMIRAWYAGKVLPDDLPIDLRAEKVLSAHRDYCRQTGVTGTPTVFIDNRPLPNIYDIEDLKILL